MVTEKEMQGVALMKEYYNNITKPKDEADRQILENGCCESCCGCCECFDACEPIITCGECCG